MNSPNLTAIVGLDAFGVAHLIEEKLSRVAFEKGVPVAPLRVALEKLGKATNEPQEVIVEIQAVAEELLGLRAQLAQIPNERPDLGSIRDQALSYIESGEFGPASIALGEGRATARRLRQELAGTEVEFLVAEAQVYHLTASYRTASEKYGEAALIARTYDAESSLKWLTAQAEELLCHGDRYGDNVALLESIELLHHCLKLAPRERSPLLWAKLQNDLGVSLATLGEREKGSARLEEALAAYRSALEEWTRERVPIDWATAQSHLGVALAALGERETGTARLEEAVTAFHLALEETDRTKLPYKWATIQNNMGNTLRVLGERDRDFESYIGRMVGNLIKAPRKRDNGSNRLEAAVFAFRAALQEWDRDTAPFSWAMAQNNLGIALLVLGERENGTLHLIEAVAAFRAALEEWTRDRAPLDWARVENNLGNALKVLGERAGNTALLDEAVVAYQVSLDERTRERVPFDWAMTKTNLGNALKVLGWRKNESARLEEAVAAHREALEVWIPEVSLYWRRIAQKNLALAFIQLQLQRQPGLHLLFQYLSKVLAFLSN